MIYEKEYKVHVYETDPYGRLSILSLFNYFQDIASDHAVRLGFGKDDLIANNSYWVLSRIYTTINHMPEWGDKIIIRTWPNGTDKVFALRIYEARHSDGRQLVTASSSWLILDRDTKKIQRPSSVLPHFREHTVSNPPVREAVKIPPPSENGNTAPVPKVRISDLDINLHTNNVGYLKWIYDSYSLDFITNNIPYSVEINYLAESLYGEEINITTSSDDGGNGFYTHSVVRIADKKELCRTRIGWEKV
jgi:medium-chain acyl-[acyl-carrier-protein] hydrolase